MNQVLGGDHVLRVNWLPGSDRLRGRCHCGAEAERDDPIAMWEWLLAHPDHPDAGPEPAVPAPEPAAPVAEPPAHVISDPAIIRRRPLVPA